MSILVSYACALIDFGGTVFDWPALEAIDDP